MDFYNHSDNVFIHGFHSRPIFVKVGVKFVAVRYFWGSNSSFLKTFLRWRNLSLEFALKLIFQRWMFIGESENFSLNGYWWKPSLLIMVFFLELYQFFFWFVELCSDGESWAWNVLSKWFSEDGFLGLMVSTSFWMGTDENVLNLSWCSYLNYINYSFFKFYQMENYCLGIFSQSDIKYMDVQNLQ